MTTPLRTLVNYQFKLKLYPLESSELFKLNERIYAGQENAYVCIRVHLSSGIFETQGECVRVHLPFETTRACILDDKYSYVHTAAFMVRIHVMDKHHVT